MAISVLQEVGGGQRFATKGGRAGCRGVQAALLQTCSFPGGLFKSVPAHPVIHPELMSREGGKEIAQTVPALNRSF